MKRPVMLWPLIFFLLFLALGGLYGGITLLVDPSGNLLGLDDVLPFLPVSDFILPGIFLLVVMGLAPLLLCFALAVLPSWPWFNALFRWSHYDWAWTGTIVLMAILAIWLIVEVLLIGLFPITYATAAIGLLILLFAMMPSVRTYYDHG